MKIALIHALKHSISPIEDAFRRLWPQTELMNLLDDSLSVDRARDGIVTPQMTQRFLTLGRYVASNRIDGILFTCSAFAECIEAVARDLAPMPVLKPNEAMIEEAIAVGGRIGLIATFAPTLVSMKPEFSSGAEVSMRLAEGALAALDAGQPEVHDRIAVDTARGLHGCAVIALAQFSLARAAGSIVAATGLKVLTTPDSAVRKLQRLLAPAS